MGGQDLENKMKVPKNVIISMKNMVYTMSGVQGGK